MKLYATVSSERATKGQGGNKFLEIEIQAEKLEDIPTRANIYRLSLKVEDNRLYAVLHDYYNGHIQNLITYRGQPKVKKEKGDNLYICTRCGLEQIQGTREQTRDFIYSDICISC